MIDSFANDNITSHMYRLYYTVEYLNKNQFISRYNVYGSNSNENNSNHSAITFSNVPNMPTFCTFNLV